MAAMEDLAARNAGKNSLIENRERPLAQAGGRFRFPPNIYAFTAVDFSLHTRASAFV